MSNATVTTVPSICKYEDVLKTDKVVINTTPFISSTSVPFVFSSDIQEAVISVDFTKKKIVAKILIAGDNIRNVSLVVQAEGANQTQNIIPSLKGVSIKSLCLVKSNIFSYLDVVINSNNEYNK